MSERKDSDSYRTFHVTLRAEVERGQLHEWLKETVPPGSLLRIEEANLEGSI